MSSLIKAVWGWFTDKRNRGFAIIIVVITLLFLVASLQIFIKTQEPVKKSPPSSPKRQMGIDLSTWQEPAKIDYDKLVTRMSFAILRLGFTEKESGTVLQKDDTFEQHFQKLSAKNLPLGVYWYSCADTPEKAKKEAEEAIRLLKGKSLQLPIFWDTEDEVHQISVGREQLTETALAFLTTVEDAGYKGGLYSHGYWLRDHLDLDQLKGYEIWVAAWHGEDPTHIPYKIWQFSETGKRPGYDGPLDLNFRY